MYQLLALSLFPLLTTGRHTAGDSGEMQVLLEILSPFQPHSPDWEDDRKISFSSTSTFIAPSVTHSVVNSLPQ